MGSVSIAVSWLLLPPEVGVNRHGLFLLAVTYAFAIPADFEFPREKVIKLTEQQVG